MTWSATVVGETKHLSGAALSSRMLTACVCFLFLAGQYAVAMDFLTLRQFDASRSPVIDIAAQIDTGLATEQVDVLELKVDQRTPVAGTKSVAFVPASSLLASRDYVYRRPVCNVFFTFAGSIADIADLADSLDFAVAFRAALANVQLRAMQFYVWNPVQEKMIEYATPERVAEDMVAQAKAFAALQPEGFLDKIASSFKSKEWLPIDTVAEEIRSFATQDPVAKKAIAHTLVVFWAGGPGEDVKKVDKQAFLQDSVTVTIGEIVGSSDSAVERARPFCRETHGSFLSKRDLSLPKRKIDYVRVISAGLDAWKQRVADRFLLSPQSRNLEETEKCWFEVGIPGSSIRQKVACSRMRTW